MTALSARDEILIAIPVLLVGGTEVHTLALVRALRSAGARVRVCCYYEYAPGIVQALKDLNVDVVLLHLERATGLWHLFRVLYALFRKLRPSTVHVQYLAPGLIPVVAARAAGVGTVFATVHQPGDQFGSRERLFLSVAGRLSTAFFCVSQVVERSWFGDSALFSVEAAALGRRHFTIYNGVEAVRIDTSPPAAPGAEPGLSLVRVGRHVIGVVGRLRAEKGQALLLNALPLVLSVVPDAVLLVVGDGPDREALLQQGRNLGIDSHIVWSGERSPAEVPALFAMMHVVAVPSQFEGFGLSAAEAMAAGRPVVGMRVGGLTEIIEDGKTGYLIAPGDVEAFAAALIRILRDSEAATEMGVYARRRASEQFSTERFAAAFVSAYRYYMKGSISSDGEAVACRSRRNGV